MPVGNGTSYGRGRKPVVTAAEDPLKLVMSSFELPVGLREAAKDKAKRLSKSGDLPKMDSISAYLRGCLVDFVAAPEPVVKNQVWKTIGKRLKAGTPEEIAKFLEQHSQVEEIVEQEPQEVVEAELVDESGDNEESETTAFFDDEESKAPASVPRYDFGDWLD